jgi:hypothetical protein
MREATRTASAATPDDDYCITHKSSQVAPAGRGYIWYTPKGVCTFCTLFLPFLPPQGYNVHLGYNVPFVPYLISLVTIIAPAHT